MMVKFWSLKPGDVILIVNPVLELKLVIFFMVVKAILRLMGVPGEHTGIKNQSLLQDQKLYKPMLQKR